LDIEPVAREFAPTVELLIDHLESVITPRQAERLAARAEPLVTVGVPRELARLVAGLDALYSALDIATLAQETGTTEVAVAGIYFALDERLELEWLRERIQDLKTDGRWEELARTALAQDLDEGRRRLTAEVVRQGPPATAGPALIETWLARQRRAVERLGRLMAEARTAGGLDLSMVSVLVGQLRGLAG
jgi:glutamate dehydrogenase